MNGIKGIGIALMVAGILALVYGGFTYTKETHDVKIGPLEMSIKDKETVNIPVWLGAGAVLIGGLLLVFGKNNRNLLRGIKRHRCTTLENSGKRQK